LGAFDDSPLAEASSMLRDVALRTLVVLGCRIQDGQLSPAAARRVERAAQAYREHDAQLVIAAGGKRWQGVIEADVFGHGLVERGVPRERVLGERESLTTRGNALGVARMLRERNVVQVGVVTCDWHMPRALALFRSSGLEPVPLPVASPPVKLYQRWWRWLRERGSGALDLALLRLWFRT
jgi:uncharacterized SAM-binding protein YcdF (DUF218 family)